MSYEAMLQLAASLDAAQQEEPCDCGAAPHQACEQWCGRTNNDEPEHEESDPFWSNVDRWKEREAV